MSTSENKKTKKSCKILSQECIGTDIYSMWLDAGEIGKNAVPGQFVSLYSRNGSKLLPRPISLCEINKEEGKLRLVYRVTGKGTGTEEFSRLHAGVPVETLGPLGNGFPLDAVKGKKVFLMGGGIGIPPTKRTDAHAPRRQKPFFAEKRPAPRMGRASVKHKRAIPDA